MVTRDELAEALDARYIDICDVPESIVGQALRLRDIDEAVYQVTRFIWGY